MFSLQRGIHREHIQRLPIQSNLPRVRRIAAVGDYRKHGTVKISSRVFIAQAH